MERSSLRLLVGPKQEIARKLRNPARLSPVEPRQLGLAACWGGRRQATASPSVRCSGPVREGSCSTTGYYSQSSVDILQDALFSFLFPYKHQR